MIVPFRSTILVIAALTASSVAPAQVNPAAEPLIAAGANELPVATATIPLPVEEAVDPLAPIEDQDQSQDVEVIEGGSLSQTVARLRSSDAGSRELECLAGACQYRWRQSFGHICWKRGRTTDVLPQYGDFVDAGFCPGFEHLPFHRCR